jgi:hypothetical protein
MNSVSLIQALLINVACQNATAVCESAGAAVWYNLQCSLRKGRN